MSGATRIPLEEARTLADEVVALLEDATDRIAVAGSIRRGQASIGDVEIVCLPRYAATYRQVDMFSGVTERVDLLHARCAELLEQGVFAHRPDKNEHPAFGRKFKRLTYRSFAVDVFSTSEQNWGVILLLRTGPSAWNQRLVLRQSQGGWLPRGFFFRDGHLWKLPPPFDASLVEHAVVVPTPEEADVFRALCYDYVRPEDRGERRPPRLAVPA